MKRIAVAVCLFLFAGVGSAVAQEHFTEGPVWACSAYRVKEGQWDNYMKYIRSNALVVYTRSKQQGLIVDFKMFTQPPTRPSDWDFMVCQLFASAGKAMDYNAADQQKMDAIQAEHWKTSDQEKMRQMSAKRYEMRDFLGVSYIREVSLRPMP